MRFLKRSPLVVRSGGGSKSEIANEKDAGSKKLLPHKDTGYCILNLVLT
jgi:hypothetical protein